MSSWILTAIGLATIVSDSTFERSISVYLVFYCVTKYQVNVPSMFPLRTLSTSLQCWECDGCVNKLPHSWAAVDTVMVKQDVFIGFDNFRWFREDGFNTASIFSSDWYSGSSSSSSPGNIKNACHVHFMATFDSNAKYSDGYFDSDWAMVQLLEQS